MEAGTGWAIVDVSPSLFTRSGGFRVDQSGEFTVKMRDEEVEAGVCFIRVQIRVAAVIFQSAACLTV